MIIKRWAVKFVLLCCSITLQNSSIQRYCFGRTYWANGKQRAKVNYSYSCLSDILSRVMKEFNLHLLLFKIFLNDLVLIVEDVNTFRYVDKNAHHGTYDTIEEVLLSVKIIENNFFISLWVIRLRVALVSTIWLRALTSLRISK